MELTTQGGMAVFAKMVVGNMSYLGPKDLTQYFIRDTSMGLVEGGSVVVTVGSIGMELMAILLLKFVLQVILGRRLIGTVLTVYFPTIIMVIISHITNYFKSFFFEADVGVNLTVMLV